MGKHGSNKPRGTPPITHKADKVYTKWTYLSGQEKGVVFVENVNYELVRTGHELYERTDSVAAVSIRGRSNDGSRRSISSLETYMKRWLTTPRTPMFPTQNHTNASSPQLPYLPLFLTS